MDIKDQVCSLELSKRLKALGFPQKGAWYWYPIPEVIPYSGGTVKTCGWEILYGNKARIYGVDTICSAPTAAEIGMALPLTTWFNHSEREFEVHDVNAKKDFVAGNEAEARGLMWEYLKKSGLIKEKNG